MKAGIAQNHLKPGPGSGIAGHKSVNIFLNLLENHGLCYMLHLTFQPALLRTHWLSGEFPFKKGICAVTFGQMEYMMSELFGQVLQA